MEAVNLKLINQEKITKPLKPADRIIEVLELLNKPVTKDHVHVVQNWFLDTEDYLNLYLTTSVLEFTALSLIFKNQYFNNFDVNNSESRLIKVLQQSRLLLTNKKVDFSALTNRLPKSILAASSRDGILFHQSSFHSEKIHNFFETLQQIAIDYIPRAKDLIYLLAFGTLMYWSSSLLHLVIGLFIGYCFSSFMEYYVHQNIGHAGPAMRRLFKKLGAVGNDMANFSLEHGVHHGSVHVNYANPFAPSRLAESVDINEQVKNRQKIDDLIFKRGGEKLLNRISKSQYGLRSSAMWRTHLFFFPISTLVLLMIELLFSNFTSLTFSFGFLIISTFWITASSVYHPCLHYTEEKVDKEVQFFIRWFLKTRFSRFIAQSHRMHHAHSGHVNQNLNVGYDYFFAWAPITIPELIDLKNKKTIY